MGFLTKPLDFLLHIGYNSFERNVHNFHTIFARFFHYLFVDVIILDCIIGLDIGTSAVKGAIMTTEGKILNTISKSFTYFGNAGEFLVILGHFQNHIVPAYVFESDC